MMHLRISSRSVSSALIPCTAEKAQLDESDRKSAILRKKEKTAARSLHACVDSLDDHVYHLLDPIESGHRADLPRRGRAVATQAAQDPIAALVVLVRPGSPPRRLLSPGSGGRRGVRHDIRSGIGWRGLVRLEPGADMVAKGGEERVVASGQLQQRQPLVVCAIGVLFSTSLREEPPLP